MAFKRQDKQANLGSGLPPSLKSLGERYAPKAVLPVGHFVTLPEGRVITDHQICDLLAADLKRTEQRLTLKQTYALTNIRSHLSEKGFLTPSQKIYLADLVARAEGTYKSSTDPADRELRNARIKAFFVISRRIRSKGPESIHFNDIFDHVVILITPELVANFEKRVREILVPYKLDGQVITQFVHRALVNRAIAFVNSESLDAIPRELRKHLFTETFNPYDAVGSVCTTETLGSCDVIAYLTEQLAGVPSDATNTILTTPSHVSDMAQYLDANCDFPSSSIADIPAGSIGSGKGGSRGHK